jgi:hypothetical protein
LYLHLSTLRKRGVIDSCETALSNPQRCEACEQSLPVAACVAVLTSESLEQYLEIDRLVGQHADAACKDQKGNRLVRHIREHAPAREGRRRGRREGGGGGGELEGITGEANFRRMSEVRARYAAQRDAKVVERTEMILYKTTSELSYNTPIAPPLLLCPPAPSPSPPLPIASNKARACLRNTTSSTLTISARTPPATRHNTASYTHAPPAPSLSPPPTPTPGRVSTESKRADAWPGGAYDTANAAAHAAQHKEQHTTANPARPQHPPPPEPACMFVGFLPVNNRSLHAGAPTSPSLEVSCSPRARNDCCTCGSIGPNSAERSAWIYHTRPSNTQATTYTRFRVLGFRV